MVEQRKTAEPRCWGGGVSHPSQLTTGLVIKSVTTSPTLAGERMLFILQVSILSEQIYSTSTNLCTINSIISVPLRTFHVILVYPSSNLKATTHHLSNQ